MGRDIILASITAFMVSAKRLAKYLLQRFYQIHPGYCALQRSIDEAKILAAKLHVGHLKQLGIVSSLTELEFRVFSQFGEDGIIQYLIQRVLIAQKNFIEFGVGKYTESNTRFLLINDNWSGLVIDADRKNVDYIRKAPSFWMHDLKAVCAFIDRDNINSIIRENGFSGEVGLLSIDIDGNDYWVWKSISAVQPAVVVIEYNSVFGCKRAITIPYDQKFERYRAHPSGLFWGASLRAFCVLGERKGYVLVGSNSAGNNAFFVRRDLVGELTVHTAESAYVESKFQDSHDPRGQLTCLSGNERRAAIRHMMVFDVETNQLVELGDE